MLAARVRRFFLACTRHGCASRVPRHWHVGAGARRLMYQHISGITPSRGFHDTEIVRDRCTAAVDDRSSMRRTDDVMILESIIPQWTQLEACRRGRQGF
jgi:hypothetical protein